MVTFIPVRRLYMPSAVLLTMFIFYARSPVMIKFKKAKGNKNFQAKSINWSTLKRGKVHLNHIITKTRKKLFIKNQTQEGRNGPFHPPRKRVVAMAETRKRLAYSAKKKIANFIPEYSTLNPATNS